VHYFILLSTRADSSGHCRPVSRRAPCMISPSCWYQVTRFVHHNSLIMWWEMNRKKMVITSASKIIYWDEQCRMFYPSSCLFMYFFILRSSSSITSRNTCFSIPSGLCVTEPEGFHCAGIYIFVQKTICVQ